MAELILLHVPSKRCHGDVAGTSAGKAFAQQVEQLHEEAFMFGVRVDCRILKVELVYAEQKTINGSNQQDGCISRLLGQYSLGVTNQATWWHVEAPVREERPLK